MPVVDLTSDQNTFLPFILFQTREKPNQECLRTAHLHRHPSRQNHRRAENPQAMLLKTHKTNDEFSLHF